MFLRYLEPIFRPFRELKFKLLSIQNTKGRIHGDINRATRMTDRGKRGVKAAKDSVQKAQGHAQKAQGQAGQMQSQAQGQMNQWRGQPPAQAQASQRPGMPPGMPPMQGHMQGAQMTGQQAGAPGALNPNPPVKWVGFFRRRKVCTQCSSELDKTWDTCPYCAQAAMAQAPAPKAAKTQAFMLDAATGGSVQLLGWLVPITGVQRGELFTLAPHSLVGTDPGTCQVVLLDQYMSSNHAEIRAEGGVWVLRDLGSTNGTLVNDRRVDKHELVDNDFIKFGQSVVKFKCL